MNFDGILKKYRQLEVWLANNYTKLLVKSVLVSFFLLLFIVVTGKAFHWAGWLETSAWLIVIIGFTSLILLIRLVEIGLESDRIKAKTSHGFSVYLMLTSVLLLGSCLMPILTIPAVYTTYQVLLSKNIKEFGRLKQLSPIISISFIYVLAAPCIYFSINNWFSSDGGVTFFGTTYNAPFGYIYAVSCYSIYFVNAATIGAISIRTKKEWVDLKDDDRPD